MVKLLFMFTDQQCGWFCLGLCLLLAIASWNGCEQESKEKFPNEAIMFLALFGFTIGAGLFVFMIAYEIISLITGGQGLLF